MKSFHDHDYLGIKQLMNKFLVIILASISFSASSEGQFRKYHQGEKRTNSRQGHLSGYSTILSIPSEIHQLCCSWLPAKDNLSLSRACKLLHNPAFRIIFKLPEQSIADLLPAWFAYDRDTIEHQNLKSLLGFLLDCLRTGEPEDFMLDIMKTELFQEQSEDYLIASGRFPRIVTEIARDRKSRSGKKLARDLQHIQHLSLELWDAFDLDYANNRSNLIIEFLMIPSFDIMKLCDFLDRYYPSSPGEFQSQEIISALINIFSGVQAIPSPDVIEAVLPVSILMLQLSRRDKERLLKTLTGQSIKVIPDDHDVQDIIFSYLDVNPDRYRAVVDLILLRSFSKIPERMLLKFLENFEVKNRQVMIVCLLVSGHPSVLYETLSGISKDRIKLLFGGEPSKLSEFEIEAAIMLLSDMEALYDALCRLGSDAEFTGFHLFLLLASNKKCSQEVKLKFALLPFLPAEQSFMFRSYTYEVGEDFVDPLLAALIMNPTEGLVQFCCFPGLSFTDLMDLKQYKLLALKLYASIYAGVDEVSWRPTSSVLVHLMNHLLRQYRPDELNSFLKMSSASSCHSDQSNHLISKVLRRNL